MNKTIRELSTYLTGLLPPDSHFYTADDLLRLGMPDFVVRRIKMEIADRLGKAIKVPSTEWLDTERSIVAISWNQFVEAVKGDAHLPRKHAAEIIENAVIEIIELIVAPRRRVIEWLFGPMHEVSLSVVRQRAHYITVNRYLIESLIRYMERKDLHTITRVAAVDVIKVVDDRYVTGYTSLSWAHLIDPLFQLAKNRVDCDLIHDFFVDKGREDLAALFPESAVRLERVQFIERLSVGARGERREQEREQEQEQVASLGDDVTVPHVIDADVEVEVGENRPISHNVPIWQLYLSEVPEADDTINDEVERVPLVVSPPNMERQPATIASSLTSVVFQKAKLVDWLKTHENAYIEGVFDGHEMAYYKTIAEWEMCRDWSEAQAMLKVWVRSVDIDLENADFAHLVDQLQVYFTTNES